MNKLKITSLSNKWHLYAFEVLLIILTVNSLYYSPILILYTIYLVKKKLLSKIFVIFLFAFLIYFIYQYKRKSYYDLKEIKGIISFIEEKDNYIKITVRTPFENILVNYKGNNTFKIGDIVILEGNKVNVSSNSYGNYLKSQHIYLQIYNPKITKVSRGFSLSLIKGYVLNFYQKYSDKTSYEFISSLVFASNSFDSELKESINNIGISYMFCISGFHISILAQILSKLLEKKIKQKYIVDEIVFIFLLSYGLICGFGVGILRAIIMFGLTKISMYKGLNLSKLDTCAIAFIIILLINPMLYYSVGLKLSFLATFFIILGQDIIKDNNKLKSNYKLTIITFFSSLPIVVSLNYEINFITIIISPIILVIFTYVIMPITYFVTIIPNISFLTNFIFNAFKNIILLTSNFNFLKMEIPTFNPLCILIYYASLIYLLILIEKKQPIFKPIYLICGLIILMQSYNLLDPYDKVIMLDVGQGDSTLIKLKHNKGNILIDSYSNIGKLKSMGIKNIDVLIITHSDSDHIQTALDIVNEFNCNMVVSSYYDDTEEINRLRKMVSTNYIVKNGNNLNLKGLNFNFIGPVRENGNINNNSLVFKIIINQTSFLFTGDMEREEEQDVFLNNKIKVDILKVAHHGANTSTTDIFKDNVSFKDALISVGHDNVYGHPHKETLKSLESSNIYRTDKMGDILIILYNKKYKICTNRALNLLYM